LYNGYFLKVTQAWITASDFSFLTTYDASGAAVTSPESVEMLCHVEAMPGAVYQWQRYVSGTWVNVAGATASTFAVYPGGEGRYRCVVTAGTLRVETHHPPTSPARRKRPAFVAFGWPSARAVRPYLVLTMFCCNTSALLDTGTRLPAVPRKRQSLLYLAER